MRAEHRAQQVFSRLRGTVYYKELFIYLRFTTLRKTAEYKKSQSYLLAIGPKAKKQKAKFFSSPFPTLYINAILVWRRSPVYSH